MSKFILMTSQFAEMNVQEEHEYHRWYWEEHVPSKLHVQGVLGAARYQKITMARPDAPQFMAVYELESPDVIESYEWKMSGDGSEWSKRVKHFSGTPGVYEIFFPKGANASFGEYLYAGRMTPTHAGSDEFDRWFRQQYLPEMAAVPGVKTAYGYISVERGTYAFAPKYLQIHELQDPSVVDSPAWKDGEQSQRAIDVLSRTKLVRSFPGVYQLMRPPKIG